MRKPGRDEAGYNLLELLFVISIVSLLAAILIPQILAQRSRLVEVQAQRHLRSIGSVMADYSLSRHDGSYADFQALKDANLISRHVSQSDLIVDYSLAFLNQNGINPGSTARYTIIAYPKPERSEGRLSTFAITEDNVVRVYRPGPGVSPNDPHTWDPIL